MGNRRFTLIELLATIVIISVVFGIGYFFATNTINNAKDKSEVISYTNIKKSANLYLEENIENISWEKAEDGNNYYTCISTTDLLDTGYLKENQIENTNVEYIYALKDDKDTIISEKIDEDGNLCEGMYNSDKIEVPTSEEICQDDLRYEGPEQEQVLAVVPEARINEIKINEDTNKGIEVGNYKVEVSLIDQSKIWNIKNADNKPKTVICKIKKAIPNVYFTDNNGVESSSIGETMNTKIISENISGTLSIKSSDKNYITGELVDGNEIKKEEEKNIIIKILSTRSTASYVTITFTPEDTKNYETINLTYTVGKVTPKKINRETLTKYCRNVTYDGEEHSIVNMPKENEGLIFLNTNYTEIGTYTVTARLKYGYTWEDETTKDATFDCDIKKPEEKKEYYILTYQNGPKCTTQKKMKGDKWGPLCKPSPKAGYTFKEWNGVRASTIVTGNVTASAIWQANTYSITYNANGGSGGPTAKTTYTYAPSGTINLSSTKPTRTGYAFKGWSLSKTASSASYAAGQKWNRNNANNYTLYAVWEAYVCTVTYNPNGGKFTKHKKNTTEKKKYGEFFGSKANGMRDAAGGYYSATRSGYTIYTKQAWKNGSNTYNEGKRYKAQTLCSKLKTSNQSITLKVNWKKKTSSGSSGSSSPNCYTYTDTYSSGKSYDSVKGCKIYGDNCYDAGGGYTGFDCECTTTKQVCY